MGLKIVTFLTPSVILNQTELSLLTRIHIHFRRKQSSQYLLQFLVILTLTVLKSLETFDIYVTNIPYAHTQQLLDGTVTGITGETHESKRLLIVQSHAVQSYATH